MRRRTVAIGAAALLSAVALGVVAPVTGAQSPNAGAPLVVGVGAGEKTVAGQAFLPGDVTVLTGSSVTFTITSDEPHTITFGDGPKDAAPPFWPVTGFTAPAANTPPPYDLGTATYSGTEFLNTGILPGKTSKATVQFTKAGTFPFFCAIHPGMAGQVTVVDSGTATTQAEADAAGAQTRDLLLGQVDQMRKDRLAATTSTANADGTTTYNVFTDGGTGTAAPMPGGGTGFLELLEYTPPKIDIKAGDSISWSASAPHTVTFVPDGTDPGTVFASEQAAFAPLGGTSYDGTAAVSSGVFLFPVDPSTPPVTTYTLTFPKAGTYGFFCLLHSDLGQVGQVVVS
ncbi:MAG: plastocyanin/azurin family copper-binding protein [Chloroflexota bacterium]